MSRHRFHLVNVFAGAALSGNALCVFEDGSALTDPQMQGLALQFNLSETTFLLPSAVATARVRIFTPTFEMPFAGHPTLGSAHVVRMLRGDAGGALTLETRAGIIPVAASGDVWTLQANRPRVRPPVATRPELAGMLGLEESDLDADPMWVDTGSEQLVIPLRSPEAVARCRPSAGLLAKHASNARRDALAYVWAHEDEAAIIARFFFLKGDSTVEDPGTGSACANLGGWLLATGAALPISRTIRQGEQTGRPCQLGLQVDEQERIHVTGNVVAIGAGEVTL
jgi:trans-2,3-dihydro-3-hydroxyanthranilate isomerase